MQADKGHDFARCHAACRARGIAPRIARRGIELRERLGRHRWVVERMLARLAQHRRLAMRYERLAGMQLALLALACAIIRWKRSQ